MSVAMMVGLAVLGAVLLGAWLAAVGWVVARRPAAEVREELSRSLPALATCLDALSRDARLDEGLRARARRAGRYVAWPIDLLPYPIHVDDVVIALDALRRIHAVHGLGVLEEAWAGDTLGWNALLAGLGLPREWETA